MSLLRSPIGRVVLLTLFSQALVAGLPSHAEVGVFTNTPDTAPLTAYIVRSIGDDPEPIGTAWLRYHLEGDGRSVLNDQGYANADGPPSVVVNPVSGLPIVAWARNSASGFDVVVSFFDNGAWSVPDVVAGSPDDELDPDLIVDPDTGDVHLYYWVDDGAPRVLHRQAPADLSAWSTAVQVSGPGEVACRPAAVVHDGALHVAYEVHDYGFNQTPRQVVLSRNVNGGYVPEVVAITQHAGEVWPQVHSHRGRLWLDWIDADDEMAWIRQDADGRWEPIRYESFSGPEEREFHVRGAIRAQAATTP